MGDRGNIGVEMHDGTRVYLYSHWGGSELDFVLADALASPEGSARLDDPPYLARIIFDHMTEGQHGQETGYGISTHVEDNEHDVLIVNAGGKTVTTEDEHGRVLSDATVEEFIARRLKTT